MEIALVSVAQMGPELKSIRQITSIGSSHAVTAYDSSDVFPQLFVCHIVLTLKFE